MTKYNFLCHLVRPTCLLYLFLAGNALQARPLMNFPPVIATHSEPSAKVGNFLATLPITLLSFSAKAQTGYNELRWKIIREVDLREFSIEYSENGIDWNKAGIVLPLPNNVDPEYSFKHSTTIEGNIYYRLKMIARDYNYTYSPIIALDTWPEKGQELQLFPTVNRYGQLQALVNEPFGNLQVFNMQGQMLMTRNLQNQTGIIRLDVSAFSKGTYIVCASRPDKKVSKTFMVL
ncbi:T9SS C-terminal target domain-containing protein [Paraflavitalea soli]|uniref:T9SS C-terminal target domain-containing protein n=1 Tax=Paraflavitalea soli TaxID=2315862 RepID=A0A3B7MVR3_9BACT|nr:T9SS type A sorting domain-containing protein [Paraflavitalea soli]AXY75745.1 T9SS C-terminal target domain-containing protein [Paraflavitalea soli]